MIRSTSLHDLLDGVDRDALLASDRCDAAVDQCAHDDMMRSSPVTGVMPLLTNVRTTTRPSFCLGQSVPVDVRRP
jgi:hypothetical protein